MYLCVCVCVCVHMCSHVEPDDNVWELVLSFCHVTTVVKSGRQSWHQALYPLSCLMLGENLTGDILENKVIGLLALVRSGCLGLVRGVFSVASAWASL